MRCTKITSGYGGGISSLKAGTLKNNGALLLRCLFPQPLNYGMTLQHNLMPAPLASMKGPGCALPASLNRLVY